MVAVRTKELRGRWGRVANQTKKEWGGRKRGAQSQIEGSEEMKKSSAREMGKKIPKSDQSVNQIRDGGKGFLPLGRGRWVSADYEDGFLGWGLEAWYRLSQEGGLL